MPGTAHGIHLPGPIDSWNVAATIQKQDGIYRIQGVQGVMVICNDNDLSPTSPAERAATTARLIKAIEDVVKELNE
jgi:uncharacterized protein (DUF362 family)